MTQATAVAVRNPLDEFRNEIALREDELASILPPHISREKFVNTAIIAVKNNPDLLTCDRRSLHAAVTKAAEDGLQPDGREGVITYFKVDGKKQAQWNPMLFGIRKRARELCDMIIDAQVVHANDVFHWHQGDDPRIEHRPAPLGTDRGEAIGAYAVFKQGGVILHREVMSVKQIESVKSVSRAQNGAMWTKFWTEAWRKTVIRRGIKTVPSVPQFERLVTRDDEHTDFAQTGNIIHLNRDQIEVSPHVVTDEQADILRALITETGTNPDKFLEFAKAESVSDVQAKEFPRLKATLEAKKAKQAAEATGA
ncbi:Recombinational DNA repair protein RecT (prophage associated) [Hyphomicrobium sulfonivorans]|uniref:Recombinational DNA repair protein RecT (Prophage associated) n=1 Tax=Hyphomicrobium sulfonivorans TaxID=121290 RepID=A0A120CXC0_HYPSL|nr:recombinase RecT [Hyphomicrobium sulfonivorans]KWT70724.1 Recombinational DNA repair protein RecT (prophage associated) [Hyphomicrobium sulfonivorans]